MVAKNSLLPMTPRSMWEAIKQLQRDVTELRAARTAEATTIGAGGLTIQAPGDPRSILLTPAGSVEIVPYAGGPSHPPAVEFLSGEPGETKPGAFMAYLENGGSYAIPTVLLTTPDLGDGVSLLVLQAGVPGHSTAVAQIAVGNAALTMETSAFDLFFEDGSSIAMGPTGIAFGANPGGALALNNSWTATGGTWQTPMYYRNVDATVAVYGSITPGTLTAGTVIATVPSGYVPIADTEFRCAGGSATAYADLVVHGEGAASPGTITITNVAGTITRLSLSQIRFNLF